MIYPWQIKFSDKEGQKIYISLTISWSKYPYLHCVQGDYKHIKTKPISPEGVFCSGVYYTRENTYKDCYIRQECSQ
jgi:hypothetical protein